MMVAFKPSGGVASAGTPNTHDLAASLGNISANWIAITNTHASALLEITFSEDGTTYTGSEFDVAAGDTVILPCVNVKTMKVDASGNGTTYTVLAWR